jgi:hypothetical protein
LMIVKRLQINVLGNFVKLLQTRTLHIARKHGVMLTKAHQDAGIQMIKNLYVSMVLPVLKSNVSLTSLLRIA